MNFNYHFPLAVWQDFEGLDIGIDDGPLAFPIAAHLIPSVDVAPFHSICPNAFGMHGRENALYVATIEESIDSSYELRVIRHAVTLNEPMAGIALLAMDEGLMQGAGFPVLPVHFELAGESGKPSRV